MSWQSDFYSSVYSTAKDLGATDTQAHLAASQASQETGFGKHVVGNNYFGVKASPSYTGATVEAETSEGEDAVSNRQNQTFRAYDGLKSSVANYMDVMARAFPDAWNATNIADAAKGLVSGKFGRYAKDANYTTKVKSIANKYGAQQEYDYAQNPENVPTPFSPDEAPLGGSLLSAFSTPEGPVSEDPFSSILAGEQQPANTTDGAWTINGVVPVPTPLTETWSEMATAPPIEAPPQEQAVRTPTVEGWSTMAAAQPIAAPMESVQAQGILSGTPPMEASAAVPSGILAGSQPISQADIARAFNNVTTANTFDPGFTEGMMSPSNPVVPTAVETTSYTPGGILSAPTVDISASRFATPEKTSRIGVTPEFDMARMTPSIDPATNIASFAGPDPAALGNFPGAMAAQRTHFGTGIYSPEHQELQAQVDRQLSNPSISKPSVLSADALPASAVTPAQPSGILSSTMATPNFNQALNPSVPSLSVPSAQMAFAAQPTVDTPAVRAIESVTTAPTPGILSSTSILNANPALASTPAITGNILSNVSPLAQNRPITNPADIQTIAQNDFQLSAPALEAVNVPDQPQVATIDGPVNTPAVAQQRQQTVSATTDQAPKVSTDTAQKKSFSDSLLSKETALGGILGGVALGPVGGILGALAGQQVAANGGLTGLLGAPTPTGGYMGYGPSAVAGIYGGAPAGSYATASDGSRVTSTGGGWVTRTDPNGVTTSQSPFGGHAGWFGGDPEDSEAA